MKHSYEIALWGLLLSASISDLIYGKIFNALVFPFFFLGLLAQGWHAGIEGFLHALLSGLLAFALFFPLYQLRIMGAGDVKLFMAVGTWVSYAILLWLSGLSVVIGALVGGGILLKKLGFVGAATNVGSHLSRSVTPKSHRMPFAPAVLCAFIFLRIAEIYQWKF